MSNEGTWSVARQLAGHGHSVPSRGLHSVEFFSLLVTNLIAIGQVKEITRHASPTLPSRFGFLGWRPPRERKTPA